MIKSKPLLHLNLKKKWFDLIAAGQKKEEYRQINPYWSRFFSGYIKIKGRYYHPTDVNICFSNGYAKNRPQMIVECVGLKTGPGKTELGAKEGEWYYIIRLGRIQKLTP